MKDKSLDLLENQIVKSAVRFAVTNKIKVIGSNAKRGILFPSDLDFLTEYAQRPKALSEELKKIFKNKKFMNEIYFMDFKLGLDERFFPYKDEDRDKWLLRWTPKDVINGYIKLYDGKKKFIEDCFDDDTIIKIDWIYKFPLTECSLNIYYNQTAITKEKEVESLKEDIREYLKTNTMKSMKRLYSLLVLTKKDKPLQKKLLDYFNSDVGIVNKGLNDLVLIKTLLEKYPNVDVYTEIQEIKANLANVDWTDANVLKKMSLSTLDETISYLQETLNEISKKVLDAISLPFV